MAPQVIAGGLGEAPGVVVVVVGKLGGPRELRLWIATLQKNNQSKSKSKVPPLAKGTVAEILLKIFFCKGGVQFVSRRSCNFKGDVRFCNKIFWFKGGVQSCRSGIWIDRQKQAGFWGG